jgi:hypothetical protein
MKLNKIGRLNQQGEKEGVGTKPCLDELIVTISVDGELLKELLGMGSRRGGRGRGGGTGFLFSDMTQIF